MVKFKNKLKPKFWRFQGQFDLEDKGQGHQFFCPKPLCDQYMLQV